MLNGITFLNRGFLPWLLAVSIPLLIHLLTRRVRRVHVLPTYQFLRQSLAQQSQVFRLRRLLLLALRTWLILLLVLTFLKPTTIAPLSRLGGGHRAVVVVLDDSLSMGYTRSGVSSLARARGQAGALLDDLRPGDVANVILAGAAPRAVLPTLGGDFGTLRQAVKSAEPTPERGDMPAAIAAAAEQLSRADAPNKELLLASDFQRSNWADVTFDAVPADVKLVFLPSDSAPRDNCAVTGLKLRPSAPRAGEEATLLAEVWNGTPTTRPLSVTLTAQLDATGASSSATTQTQVVITPPYATGNVAFNLTFPDAGRYRLTASLPPDNLPDDTTRYLVADLGHSLSVLLLTDADIHSDKTAAYFLATALNPTPDIPGGLRVVPMRAADLTLTDLKANDLVLLDELTTLPADRLALLARYVSSGGALMIFLTGPHILSQLDAFAKLLPEGEGLPFLPYSLMDVRSQGRGYITLKDARYESPLLKIFKDPGAGDLLNIHFTQFFLTNTPDPRTEVLLRYEDGTPAAARRNIGAGSLLLCNFSPRPAESDLARQEVFPPLLHEFVKGMTAREEARREFFPGGAASITLDTEQAQGAVTAIGPEGESEPVTVDRASGGVIVERVENPGFHTILVNGQPAASLAVNPHPDESDLRAIDPRALENHRGAHPVYTVGAGSGDMARLDALRHGRPLWPYCLALAFLALLLEQAVLVYGTQTRVRPRA